MRFSPCQPGDGLDQLHDDKAPSTSSAFSTSSPNAAGATRPAARRPRGRSRCASRPAPSPSTRPPSSRHCSSLLATDAREVLEAEGEVLHDDGVAVGEVDDGAATLDRAILTAAPRRLRGQLLGPVHHPVGRQHVAAGDAVQRRQRVGLDARQRLLAAGGAARVVRSCRSRTAPAAAVAGRRGCAGR